MAETIPGFALSYHLLIIVDVESLTVIPAQRAKVGHPLTVRASDEGVVGYIRGVAPKLSNPAILPSAMRTDIPDTGILLDLFKGIIQPAQLPLK